MLHTVDVYKILAKVHQRVYRPVGSEILVSEILFWKYLEYVPIILCNDKN